jgi:hypothetical protein
MTTDPTNASSPEISYYNDFVNGAADDEATPITGVVGKLTIADIEWKAIVSTPTVDAIFNIGESPAPIYNPLAESGGGWLVADGTLDLFDGSLVTGIDITEKGWWRGGWDIWTGSLSTGYRDGSNTLGPDRLVRTGNSAWTSEGWIHYETVDPDYGLRDSDTSAYLYAISEELTVVPVPAALILGATGLLSSTLGLIRLRRKDQEPSQI